MSEAKRAYDLLRGYVNREWERIKEVDWDAARKEIDDAIHSLTPPRREDALSPTVPEPPASNEPQPPTASETAVARELLGVSETASFEEIRKAFMRLNRRSDPSRFPEGSKEANAAAEIQKRIHRAYQILTANVDDADRRFKSLDI